MKRVSFLFLFLELFFCLSGCSRNDEREVEIKIAEQSISMYYQGTEIWRLNHDPQEGKPYIHPVATLDGVVFSDLRPDDHPWHRALWFSWKFINGVNYWEEDRQSRQSDGQTLLLDVDRTELAHGDVRINMKLAYAPADTGKIVLGEQRTVFIHAPDSSGAYRIDWSSTFTARNGDVILDRTPIPGEPGGQSWGGYAGYSFRMNQEVSEGTFASSAGLMGKDADRQSARWVAYSSPKGGSILFLDHPDNLNHPAKWYIAEHMPYFSPALIHDGAHTVPEGGTLALQYRVVVTSDTVDASDAEREWETWTREH